MKQPILENKDKNKQSSPHQPGLQDNYQLLLEGVEIILDYAIFILSPEGIILTWNAGANRLKGYTADEIIGEHFSRFYTEDALKESHPAHELELASKEGRYEEEGWRVKKDGSLFWANVVITAIRNKKGELLGFAKVTRDLTERKQLLDQLRKAKEEAEAAQKYYRFLVEGVRDYAILMLDPDGIIRSWNSGVERIKGYKADEIIGKHFSVFYPTEDVENSKCEFELEYAQLDGVFEDEGLRIRKDGSQFWANVLITALKDEQGKLIGYSKITRDITDRKNAEQALRESEKRYRLMADKVIQRTKEYQRLNKQLEAINKELEAFSYSVSHDLRAPLRSIDGFSQAILEDYETKLDSEGVRYLNRIRESTQQMAQLIDGMLNLSRLTRGPLTIEPVDVTAMSKVIADELRASDPDREVDFSIQEGLKADADKRLLRSVLANLLNNAWKFTSHRLNTARIEVGHQTSENGTPVFYIRDNGAGFDMAYQEKLFGTFQRLHDMDEFPGTGIGLATVQRIIHRHGGDIWAEGTVDQGATFFFTLGGERRSLESE